MRERRKRDRKENGLQEGRMEGHGGERKSGLMVSRKGGERGKQYAGGGSYDREDFEVG